MTLLSEIQHRTRSFLQPLLAACLIFYFGYHAIQGDRGILALLELKQEIADARAAKDSLVQEREALEERVALLRPDSLDPDMLEERARKLLNMAHGDDLVVSPELHSSFPAHQLAHR